MRSSQHNSGFAVYGIIFLIFIFCLMMVIAQNANANHMLGSALRYTHLTADKYEVEYSLLKECNGQPAPLNMNLRLESANGQHTSFHSLNPVTASVKHLGQICSSSHFVCEGGNARATELWTYRGVIEIPTMQNDWILSVTDCCRNTDITSLAINGSTNLYTEAFLNNLYGPNSSGSFLSEPEDILLLDEHQTITAGITEPDGDSIVYVLSTPMVASDEFVIYTNPFTKSKPLGTEIQINQSNGEITLKPELIMKGILVIKAMEYRNGIHIGTMSREMQLSVIPAMNQIPQLSGINRTSEYTAIACKGSELSFEIFSFDGNDGQQVDVSWTCNIPEAKISSSQDQHPVVRFSWTPSLYSNPENAYTLSITVTDNACPFPSRRTYSYSILVSDMDVQIASTPVTCPGANDATIDINMFSGQAPYSIQWSDSPVQSNVRKNLSEGIYSLTITDAANCTVQKEVEIMTNGITPSFSLGGSIGACTGYELVLQAPLGDYTYEWSNASTSSSLSVETSGTYTVEVTDPNGCKASSSVYVIFHECNGMEKKETASDLKLSVYPIPASDQINITWTNTLSEKINFIVHDVQGKQYGSFDEYSSDRFYRTLDIQHLSPGIYFLTIQSNSLSERVKFIKH